MVSNISLATKIIILSDPYVLFYLKWVDTQNILKMKEKICLSIMITYWLNIMKLGTKLQTLGIKFHSMPFYDEKYIKAKEHLMV